MFMWDACKDLTLVILMVAAAASLALGIKSEVRLDNTILVQFFALCWVQTAVTFVLPFVI